MTLAQLINLLKRLSDKGYGYKPIKILDEGECFHIPFAIGYDDEFVYIDTQIGCSLSEHGSECKE